MPVHVRKAAPGLGKPSHSPQHQGCDLPPSPPDPDQTILSPSHPPEDPPTPPPANLPKPQTCPPPETYYPLPYPTCSITPSYLHWVPQVAPSTREWLYTALPVYVLAA